MCAEYASNLRKNLQDAGSSQRTWCTVCVTVRSVDEYEAVKREVTWLWKCGAIDSDNLIIVDDPCKDIGSGGSSLNALLIVCENLCSQRGFSVLTESVLNDSRILIIHLGRDIFANRCGTAFMDLGRDTVSETGFQVPQNLFVMQLMQITKLARGSPNGVWICGSDAFWKIADTNFMIDPVRSWKEDQIIAFSFHADRKLAETAGTYRISSKNEVVGINYMCSASDSLGDTTVPLVLAVIFFPVRVSVAFLSLHDVYPLSSSAYYGVDMGGGGLKLSLFFDFVNATAVGQNREEFISSRGPCLLTNAMSDARRIVYDCFSKFTTQVVFLNIERYQYLHPMTEENVVNFCQDVLCNIGLSVYLPGLDEKTDHASWSIERCFAENWEQFFNRCLLVVRENLLVGSMRSLRPIFLSICTSDITHTNTLIDCLHNVCMEDNDRRCTHRALSCVADVLTLLSGPEGGLRSGPALNPSFQSAVVKLEDDETVKKGLIELREILHRWMSTPSRMVRAARHYEAAAQVFTRKCVVKICQKWLSKQKKSFKTDYSRGVRVCVASRVDIAGGWTDTPPITLQLTKSAVVNMAVLVDGQKPLKCEVTPMFEKEGVFLKELCLSLTVEDIRFRCNKPLLPGSLICSSLIVSGFIQPGDISIKSVISRYLCTKAKGVEISTFSALPHGSGMGTSSILAAAIIAALWSMMSVAFDELQLSYAVLHVEQLLTTGGGWQDQVGGLFPGVKISRFNTENGQLLTEPIPIDGKFVNELEHRLVLVYTGKTRLAKNLLQEVVRNWFSRNSLLLSSLSSLAELSESSASKLANGEFPVEEVKSYYEIKKCIATGCEPLNVKEFKNYLEAEKIIESAWIAGAGGGGFLYLWLTSAGDVQRVLNVINNHSKFAGFTLHSVNIDMNPLHIEAIS